MNYTEVNGQLISKMSLGTVQLGMFYGIANQEGQPKPEESYEMLRTALTNGISSLDTARLYGNAEEVLGDFLKQYQGNVPFITTKVGAIEAENPAEIERVVVESVETSLEKLGVKKVSCVMLHNSVNLYKNADLVAGFMGGLVKRGYTDMVGASVYVSSEVDEVFKHGEYTAVQVPMSIFDQRMIADGTIAALEKRSFTTFVRSVFLQGVFFLDPDTLTDPIMVEYAAPKIRLLRDFAEKEGMSIAEMAISFMRDVPGVTSLVLGADTSEQVTQNIKYFDAKSISEKTTAAIRESFKDVNIPEIMKVLSRPRTN